MTVNSGASAGSIRQVVRMTTNAPGQENMAVTITAQVVVDLEAIPFFFQFEENQLTKEIFLKSQTDVPIEILKLVSPSGIVKLSASATSIPAQGEVTLKAELPTGLAAGMFSEWVEVHTNLSTQPVLQIRLRANIQQ